MTDQSSSGMRAAAVQPDLVSLNTFMSSFECLGGTKWNTFDLASGVSLKTPSPELRSESLWMCAVACLRHSLGQRFSAEAPQGCPSARTAEDPAASP